MVRRFYKIGESHFGIRTTSREVGEWIDYALSRYRTSEEGQGYYSLLVSKNRRAKGAGGKPYHILYENSLVLIRTLDLPTLGRALLGRLEAPLFRERDDVILANAALITAGGTAALIPSASMFSISALGKAVKRAGVTLPTDTFTAIDPGTGRVLPISLKLEVPEDAIYRLAQVGRSGDGDRLVIHRPYRVDIVCSFGLEPEPLIPVTRSTALVRLAGDVLNMSKMGRAGLDGLARLVRTAECYELSSGPPGQVLMTLARVLSAQRP